MEYTKELIKVIKNFSTKLNLAGKIFMFTIFILSHIPVYMIIMEIKSNSAFIVLLLASALVILVLSYAIILSAIIFDLFKLMFIKK